MKYKNIKITESIIKVPKSFMTVINMYVSSCLYYIVNSNLKAAQSDETQHDEIPQLKSALALLNNKYGAKNISKQSYNHIINNQMKINVDFDTFFKELNYKGVTPEVIEKAKKFKSFLKISDKSSSTRGSVETSNVGGTLEVIINIAPIHASIDPLPAIKQIMSTVYHESQHVVQSFAIQLINPKSNQLQHSNEDPQNDDNYNQENYYSSGVEFSPQLGNLVDAVQDMLEMTAAKGKLTGKKSTDIQNALYAAMEEKRYSTQRTFLVSIYRKDKERYKKVLKTVYKKASEVYDYIKEGKVDPEFSDLPVEELEASVNIMLSTFDKLKQVKSYDVVPYGESMNSLSKIQITSTTEGWTCSIIKRSDSYSVSVVYENMSESKSLTSTQLVDFVGLMCRVDFIEADELLDMLSTFGAERITPEVLKSIIDQAAAVSNGIKVDFNILSNDSFEFLGINFTLEQISDLKISMNSEEEGIFISMRPTQFGTLIYKMAVLVRMERKDEIYFALINNISYIGLMVELNKIYDEAE